MPEYCYLILKGSVMSYEYTPSGGRRIHRLERAGALILEANVLLGAPVSVSCSAATDIELIRMTRRELEAAIRAGTEAARYVIDRLSRKCLEQTEQISELARQGATWRACKLLVSFAELYGESMGKKVLIREKISQQAMAELLGINRITLVRIIKKLRSLGLIERSGGFHLIPDMGRLKAYMEEL
jgi:CRP/FNR family transcriptional regulator